jgi:hypothetical protein
VQRRAIEKNSGTVSRLDSSKKKEKKNSLLHTHRIVLHSLIIQLPLSRVLLRRNVQKKKKERKPFSRRIQKREKKEKGKKKRIRSP